MAKVVCPSCNGDGVDQWFEDGHPITETCYGCGGTGRVDEVDEDDEQPETSLERDERIWSMD